MRAPGGGARSRRARYVPARRRVGTAPGVSFQRGWSIVRSGRAAVFAALMAVQLSFSTLPIAAKVVLRELPAPSLALLRVTGAAVLFVLLHRSLVRERVERGDVWRLALYALFGVVLNQLLYITALTLTTATAAQTMVAVGPALTLFGAIVTKRERASAAKWAGIALAGAGALLLVGAGLGSGHALGNLLALLNVAAYSTYLVISRDLARRYDPLTVITWVFVFGAVGILPWGAPVLARHAGGISTDAWLALAWIVAVPTVAAYYLNVWALRRVESSVVSVFVYLQPILTALMAVPLLGERVSPRMIPAAGLIFAGLAVTVWAERSARRVRVDAVEGEFVEEG